MEPTPGKSQTFYRWLDSSGRLHVVSSLDSVPPAERSKAAVVVMSPGASPAPTSMDRVTAWRPDWISFAVGFAVALLLAVAFKLLPNGLRVVSRVLLVLCVGALLTGLYLSAVRASSGVQSGDLLTSPSALIQDARGAVEQMNRRQKQQEEELRKLQTEP